jgi:hypothetical protein
MASAPIPEDTRNKLEDLSGIVLKPGENPYAAFIKACENNPVSRVTHPRTLSSQDNTLHWSIK